MIIYKVYSYFSPLYSLVISSISNFLNLIDLNLSFFNIEKVKIVEGIFMIVQKISLK